MKDFDISEEEIDELLEKHITQEDSIDENVDEHLQSMGFLWMTVHEKLQEDGICFSCKKKIDFKEDKVSILKANNTEPGVVAFVLICEECQKKILEQESEGEQ
jgi:hypothetical protein